jgi:hypothetical protein
MHKTSPAITVALGIIVANIIGFAIISLTQYMLTVTTIDESNTGAVLVYSEFVIVPMLIGVVAVWFTRNINLSRSSTIAYSLSNTIVAIFLSHYILKEGVVCLVIVSPLIWVFVITGSVAGQHMFKKNHTTLNFSIVSLLLLIIVADVRSKHHYQNMVSDEIVINAPAYKVWKNVVAFEKIKQKNNYWLFKAGMPSPMQTTVEGYYKGAGRKCIFSNGYVFDEKIVTYEPGKDLTFDIVHQPRDPEIMGHIDILRGQFLLKDNGDGTTTVTGNSWYKLYVFPTWYYDLWAESVTRNVHLRVMEHIKELSEKR